MKLVYGTKNLAKVQHMRDMLRGLDLELVSLNDVGQITVGINESGNDPLENVCIKAKAYFNVLRVPVFSCDSGLIY
ncbi:MAG: hypothetical protein GX971_05195 [Firmicutes bacterium]|nr:hypothetical protein [Bacillota bacterium]